MTNLEDIGFKPGDIGLSTSQGWMSKMIKFFTSWHTQSASYNHCFTFIDNDTIAEASGKIKATHLADYEKIKFVVYRIPLTKEEREAMKLGMLSSLQSAYGWTKLPLFALDAAITKVAKIFKKTEPVFFFTKYFDVTHFMVCSQFVAWALSKFTSYKLKDKKGKIVSWKVVQPDYMEDLLQLPRNKAEKIYENNPPI